MAIVEAMDQIFRNYLINKDAESQKSSILKPPKIDVKKKDYDSIVKLVDTTETEPRPLAITKNKKK